MVKNGLLALLVLALLAGCGAPPVPAPPALEEEPASHDELARRYAPVIYQGAASDQDYITAVDLDGDWIGNNNWENQPAGDLSAYVYYAVAETESHWFLFYALYHPRDYTEEPCEQSDGCHENDMESLQVVVARDGSAYGRPQALLTLAHSHIYLYPVDSSVKKGALRLQVPATLEDGHPAVWVETYGHGIYGKPQILVPGTVVYRAGDRAEIPEGIKDKDVAYELVPIYDTIWQHRSEIGPGKLFDKPFDYKGHILPASFDGEDWGQDRANPPWGYDQEIDEALLRGDFFMDPARALEYFATIEGDLSRTYVHNLFLADLGLDGAP
ncbi:MAG: hypothetical protein GX597_07255 [Anaerolineaceae bacterium]|nr:hypothetical protein [Anaerolineaceae bacterium]